LDAVAATEGPEGGGLAGAQDAGGHHERLDEDFRILNRHLVLQLVAVPREPLDHVHAARVEQPTAAQPRRVDEVYRVDDERIPFPAADAVAVVVRLALRPRVALTAVGRDVAELR